ncbi:MAG: hypothetical protein HRU12_22920, partial [Phaeodactylibacter sp.]|nr:hypothetical protein [Phaeodactylibacter sp.]
MDHLERQAELIEKIFQGSVSEAENEEINLLIQENEEFRELYLDLSRQHSELQTESRIENADERALTTKIIPMVAFVSGVAALLVALLLIGGNGEGRDPESLANTKSFGTIESSFS